MYWYHLHGTQDNQELFVTSKNTNDEDRNAFLIFSENAS